MTELQTRAAALKKTLDTAIAKRDAVVFDDDASPEDLQTAQIEVRALETRFEAAEGLLATEQATAPTDPPNDGEGREIRALRTRTVESGGLAQFIEASAHERKLDGAIAEYVQARKMPIGQVPADLLLGLSPAETRAITPGPANETVSTTDPTVPFAFSRTDTAALGVAMPTVPAGEKHYPVLTTAPPASMVAKGADAPDTAAAFSLTKRTGIRLAGQYQMRVEDLALFAAMDSDLRAGINGQMASQLDDQVIDGDGAAPNLSGLFNQATDVSATGAVETFATGVSRYAALVEGQHSNGFSDLRALIGTETFARYAAQFQSNGDVSLADYLAMKMGLLRVSTRVPDVAATYQKAIIVRAAQGRPISVPRWGGVEVITDRYTMAKQGIILVTAQLLVGSPFIPYGTSQVVEVNPKVTA